jgi:hypothetical protein
MRHPTKFDGMMYEFCVRLGWCGSTIKDGEPVLLTDFIPDTGSVTAEQLVEWLMLADGVDFNKVGSSWLKRWRRELKAVFVKHLGAEVADAVQLR